jgi:prepilin-type processing-associated H-X9-DG protein
MIVVAIIAVLLALLQPVFFSLGAHVDHYRCTANLYHLSQAIAMRRADAAISAGKDVKPRSWPAQLLAYVNGGAETMTCPVQAADESEVAGGDAAGLPSGSDGGPSYTTPDDTPKSYAPLSELLELMLSGGRAYQPMEAGPWTVKLSEEQYQQARGLGYFRGDGSRNLRGAMDTNYNTGSNPNVYYLCFEDNITTGGDMDFNDTMIRVTDRGNGSYDLSISGHTGASHAVVNKADRLVVIPLTTGRYYEDLPLAVGSAGAAAGSGSSPGDAGQDAGAEVLGAVCTNYGMNGDYTYLTLRPGRIALMDYLGYLAHGTDNWTDESLDPDGDGVPVFARHWGRVNVLMTDGSVQLMDPLELDPARPKVYSRYWKP